MTFQMTFQHMRARTQSIFAAVMATAALGVATIGHAQIPTLTNVTSNLNPALAGQPVVFTAAARSAQLAFTPKAGVGRIAGTSLYFRFDLVATKFGAAVTASQLTNTTAPGAFANRVIAQGGAVGDSYVVFQVTAGAGGVAISHDIRFLFTSDEINANTFMAFTVHDSASSAFGPVPANTAVVYRPDPTVLTSITAPFTVTGSMTFRNNGVNIAGCVALPLSAASANCEAMLNTAGTFAITAIYSGDVNYATSTGTLTDGQRVLVDISPATQLSATVAVPFSLTFMGVGGVAPYTFSVAANDLPAGLSMSSTGVLSGTPTRAVSVEFTVLITDSANSSSSRKTSIVITKGAQSLAFNPPVAALVGGSLTLPTTSSIGLLVGFNLGTPETCRIDGNILRFISTGPCVVTPLQSGDSDYFPLPANPRQINVEVAGGVQPLRMRTANAQSQLVDLSGNLLRFTTVNDPGQGFRVLGTVDLDGNARPDVLFQNTTQGEFGDVRFWRDGDVGLESALRSVKLLWRLDAVGDLDGDGFGDLVWRFTGQTPNIDDTGVSYVWFTNGSTVNQVRKRGGAPLNWTLLGARDVNGDGAADMVYISPNNEIRVLVATAGRTCANFAAGSIPSGFTALKLGGFTAYNRAEILVRNATTGELRIVRLSAAGLSLPAPTANPDDPNASCTATTTSITSTVVNFGTVNAALQFFGTADLNADGMPDLIWIAADRSTVVWLSQGTDRTYAVLEGTGTVPAGYSAITP